MLSSSLFASALLLAAATEAMPTPPENYTSFNETMSAQPTTEQAQPVEADDWTAQQNRTAYHNKASWSTPVAPARGTYRNVVYFTNWGIYAANHQPADIAAGQITHLLYSFALISSSGDVVSSDTYADISKRFPGDVAGEPGKNVYGCVKQLYLLKRKHRKLKTLLSIGGWTLSYKFPGAAATDSSRRRFALSAVALMGDWGMDGIDIDWEYPQDATQAGNFVKLLMTVREALDLYAKQHARGYRFTLTIAVPAGKSNYQKLKIKEMRPFVDGWHVMAYDYAGSWEKKTGHQSNLYGSSDVSRDAIKADTHSAIAHYRSQGVDPRKIMLGLPLYGHSFANTAGLGQPYNGQGKGSIEKGIWHYKALPLPGSTELWDQKAVASYSYDKKTRELVTYDNPRAAREKVAYLQKQTLGGAVFWESSGDKKGANSLVGIVAAGMKTLDPSTNWLTYPGSQYDNMKKQMK